MTSTPHEASRELSTNSQDTRESAAPNLTLINGGVSLEQLTETDQLEAIYEKWSENLSKDPESDVRQAVLDLATEPEAEDKLIEEMSGYLALLAIDSDFKNPIEAYKLAVSAALSKAVEISTKKSMPGESIIDELIDAAVEATTEQLSQISLAENSATRQPEVLTKPITSKKKSLSDKTGDPGSAIIPINLPPKRELPITKEQLSSLFIEAKAGESEALQTLAARFTRLAYAEARKFAYTTEVFEDIQQVALEGLIKAIKRFDTSRGNEFSTFAIPTISGEIKRHFRDRVWSVRVPRNLQELQKKIRVASIKMEAQGLKVNTSILSETLGVSEEEITEAIIVNASGAYQPGSLDRRSDMFDHEGDTFLDSLSDKSANEEYDKALIDIDFERALKQLPERLRVIVSLRREGKSQKEISDIVGISQMHVSRLLRSAKDTLIEEMQLTAVKRDDEEKVET